MKKIKILFLSLIITITLTGCFKDEAMDDIDIYATTYPIYYLINSIYGFNSDIDSIYPNGIDIDTYKLTEKKLDEYAQTDLFVYNGLSNEKNIAAAFLNKNKHIKIIDSSRGTTIKNDVNELWLCPSNYLMLAQNIKDSLLNYVNSTIIKQEIEDNYEDIKLIISQYDAELKTIAESSSNKTVIVGNDVFKFLEKYGFEVLSIANDDTLNAKEYNKAKRAIENKTNSYVFTLTTDKEDENVIYFTSLGATNTKIDAMINLTDEQEENNVDYISMMDSFMEQLKMEVYK